MSSESTTAWTYLEVRGPKPLSIDTINKRYGQQGWELASVVITPISYEWVYIFKRPSMPTHRRVVSSMHIEDPLP